MSDFPVPRAYLHDGDGARICELNAAVLRSFRTGEMSTASALISETDEALLNADPRLGRILVIESTIYPLIWAGPVVSLEGAPFTGTVTISARSYESILGERYLPSGYALTMSAGGQFTALLSEVERTNATGVTIAPNIAAGPPVDDINYGDRSLLQSWSLLSQMTAHEWWLEHEVARGQLQTAAHYRLERGLDRTADAVLTVGANGNMRVNRWRSGTDSTHQIRAIAGGTSTTQGFTERSRVSRRYSSSAPTPDASVAALTYTRHGYQFGRWPTGSTIITRREQLAIMEAVRSYGALATAAEAALVRANVAQRAIDLEVQGNPDLWKFCLPGDIITLNLPPYYFVDGYNGPAAIMATDPREEMGTLMLTVEVPSAQ